jgi:hypothetical protein
MRSLRSLALAVAFASLPASDAAPLQTAARVGPFFEPNFPFFQSPLNLHAEGREDFAVRGILLPLAGGQCAVFDQDLLRLAALWSVPAGQPLVTLKTMSQTSYAVPRRKAGADHPTPTGPSLLNCSTHPGVATSL